MPPKRTTRNTPTTGEPSAATDVVEISESQTLDSVEQLTPAQLEVGSDAQEAQDEFAIDQDPEVAAKLGALKELQKINRLRALDALIERERKLADQLNSATNLTTTEEEANANTEDAAALPTAEVVASQPPATQDLSGPETPQLREDGAPDVAVGQGSLDDSESIAPSVRPADSVSSAGRERKPPKLHGMSYYLGKTMREYQQFVARLELWFEQYDYWFNKDEHRVQEAALWLGNNLMVDWKLHRDETFARKEPAPTWKDFCDFLLKQINDPKLMQQDAWKRYMDAKQREG
jgi:hypothetical protein